MSYPLSRPQLRPVTTATIGMVTTLPSFFKDSQDFIAVEVFITARRGDASGSNFGQPIFLVVRHAQLSQGRRQADFLYKRGQSFDAVIGEFCRRLPFRGNAPYFAGKAGKFFRPGRLNMAVLDRQEDGQSAAVIAVRKGPQGVL